MTFLFLVSVIPDLTPPVISGCPDDINTVLELGTRAVYVNWTEPNITDSQDTYVSVYKSHYPSSSFPVGRTGVAYIARDDSGNTATCHFYVTVVAGKNIPDAFRPCTVRPKM